MVNTIKNVKMILTAMYSTQSPPPLIRESKQLPPFPYQVIIAKYFNIFNITNLKSQYILLLNHTTSIWHIFIVARAELWVSGVTPAQQAESTLISAFGKVPLESTHLTQRRYRCKVLQARLFQSRIYPNEYSRMTACQYELRREHQVRLQSASREYFFTQCTTGSFLPSGVFR